MRQSSTTPENLISKSDIGWRPTFIDIEKSFAEFVRTYRGGKIVEEDLVNLPPSTLSADYFFPDDSVIVELKCMMSDDDDKDIQMQRLMSSAKHFGINGSEVMGWFFRGEPVPEKILRRMSSMSKRSVVESIKKANKQIASTKKLLETPKAKGLILLANSNNFHFTQRMALNAVVSAFRNMPDCHADCIVYFSPNVYYHTQDDGIARSFWMPVYNVGSEAFGDFVNDFGRAWISFAEKFGDPYLERVEKPELLVDELDAPPISAFKK